MDTHQKDNLLKRRRPDKFIWAIAIGVPLLLGSTAIVVLATAFGLLGVDFGLGGTLVLAGLGLFLLFMFCSIVFGWTPNPRIRAIISYATLIFGIGITLYNLARLTGFIGGGA